MNMVRFCSIVIVYAIYHSSPHIGSCFLYRVNSRELRRVVDEAIDNAEVKPSTIRFFRGAMFNMVS